ncbi:MAG: DNA polymerase III subunit delta [Lautropia sp.]
MATVKSADAFERALARALPPLVWVSGDEPLLVIEAGDAVRARARAAGFAERSVVEVGVRFDASLLIEAARSLSLFGERKLVDLRLAVKPSRDFGDALAGVLAGLGDDCRLLVSSDRLERATVGTAWFGALAPSLLWYEVPRIERDALPDWLAARLARQQQRASRPVLALIADRTEGNLLAAHQALQRLGLLLPPGELDPDQVAEVVLDSARYAVFGLVDVALAGDPARALRVVDGLRAEDAALPLVAGVLADGLRRLARAQLAVAGGQPVASALRSAGVFGRREAVMQRALPRLSQATVRGLLREAAHLDRIGKGVGGPAGSVDGSGGVAPAPGAAVVVTSEATQDPWAVVERIVIGLAGAPVL